jgi:hypothetical protein
MRKRWWRRVRRQKAGFEKFRLGTVARTPVDACERHRQGVVAGVTPCQWTRTEGAVHTVSAGRRGSFLLAWRKRKLNRLSMCGGCLSLVHVSESVSRYWKRRVTALTCPTSGRVPCADSDSWSPTGCSDRRSWHNSRSVGGRSCPSDGCTRAYKHKSWKRSV